jgi:UDPglucose 6-dehydrogenase
MKVCVCGLWHLGSVIAACLAEHFTTVGYDPDANVISNLTRGQPPLFETGLAELIQAGFSASRLSFTNDIASAVNGADIVWITFDTPVDDNDIADVGFVSRQITALFSHLSDKTTVLISSQVPVGFTASAEAGFRLNCSDRRVSFAYVQENLRVGMALDAFRCPERIVIGVRHQSDQARLSQLLSPFCRRLEWMSVESAEMTKHAVNAFLAASVAFINELATLCAHVGADVKEVERGLKSDCRIGPSAYLSPGSAFAGGTLARDVNFLSQLGQQKRVSTHLMTAIRISNDEHKAWPRRKLQELFGELSGKTVVVLGLTYKPGTDTLRRSSAIELCIWLAQQGAQVRVNDPGVTQLPPELQRYITLCPTANEALQQADVLIVTNDSPTFKSVSANDCVSQMRTPIVLDPNRFLRTTLGADCRLRYVAVGEL